MYTDTYAVGRSVQNEECEEVGELERILRMCKLKDDELRTGGRRWSTSPEIIILPQGFKCTECGCEVKERKLGIDECAWCHGRGRRLQR